MVYAVDAYFPGISSEPGATKRSRPRIVFLCILAKALNEPSPFPLVEQSFEDETIHRSRETGTVINWLELFRGKALIHATG